MSKKRANPLAPGEDALDPATMKVRALKEELEKRGLKRTGKKAELVRRLERACRGILPILYTRVIHDMECSTFVVKVWVWLTVT